MFRLRNILILFIAALIIIFCARAGWLGSFSRSLTLDVSGFFVRVVNYPGQKLSYYWNLFQFRSAVLRENTALKLQLENLQHKYDQTRDLQARVHELEQMLNLQRDYDFDGARRLPRRVQLEQDDNYFQRPPRRALAEHAGRQGRRAYRQDSGGGVSEFQGAADQ